MDITVVKTNVKSNESLFDFIQEKTLSNVLNNTIAQLWSNTTGFVNNYGSFANMDTKMYLKAILSDGTEVQCHTEMFYASCTVGAEHQKEMRLVAGEKSLPSDWVEITLERYRHYDTKNKFTSPNYFNTTIAKNNGDGTATVFKTRL